MFKFEIGNNVIIKTDNHFNNKTGIVEVIFPSGMMDMETIYKIKYSDSNNSGMFKETELKLVSENEDDFVFDERLWGLKCVLDFKPYFMSIFKKPVYAQFSVRKDEVFRVHDKVDDMWKISYNNGRLFWTQLEQLKKCCVSISSKDLE